uniref:Uncharacterized protein n=1 Tax=Anguilla anguilla TaxID=7936 RepID=A0A0E9XFM2_ANGAN
MLSPVVGPRGSSPNPWESLFFLRKRFYAHVYSLLSSSHRRNSELHHNHVQPTSLPSTVRN